MTLSTHVYVLDEVNVHELFRVCQTLLTKYDDAHRPPHKQRSTDQQGSWQGDDIWSIRNHLGQGLPAILGITYRPDAPLWTAEDASTHTEDCEEDCDGDHYRRACWADIDFDTAYSARSCGMGCGQIHAALVAEVGEWLDARNVRWEWRNEFTGEVHGGGDRYERLADLSISGEDAADWTNNTVLPAILRHAMGAVRR